MQLPEISIRRPVFATVLSLLIVLLGWVSFNRLTVREYPKIDNPVVTVETKYVGAPPSAAKSKAKSRSSSSSHATLTRPPPMCATRSRGCASACPRALTNR
jgi:hypothetical protein